MKIVIQNKIGSFSLTKEQALFLHELSIRDSENYPKEAKLIDDEYHEYWSLDEERIGDRVYLPFFDSAEDCDKFRSHPWLIEMETKMPDDEHKIVEIEGEYYRIIETECGTEYVITPDVNEFVKGY